jgi:integrase
MRAVGNLPHLFKHRNGQYYFRIAVPVDLKDMLGVACFKRSLKTSDKTLAFQSCRVLSNRAEWGFSEIRQIIANKQKDGLMSANDEKLKDAVRKHFEKCLYEGENDLWRVTTALRDYAIEETGQEIDPEVLRAEARHLRQNSLTLLNHLQELQSSYDYNSQQSSVAKQLCEKFDISTPDTGAFVQVCLMVLRAQAEAEKIKLAYYSGNPAQGSISDPLFSGCRNFFEKPAAYWPIDHSQPTLDVPSEVSLAKMVNQYISYKKIDGTSEKRVKDIESTLRKLTEYLGPDTDISTLTKKVHGTLIKEFFLKFPANYQTGNGQGVREIVDGNDDYDRIATATAVRFWGATKAFFTWCTEEKECILRNPLEGIKFPKPKPGENRRHGYRPEQLEIIFTSPVYTGGKNTDRALWVASDDAAVTRDGYFWVPLIGMYTGFRMKEILSLYPHDVRKDKGVLYFDVNDYEEDKVLKTEQSARGIPIHPDLLAMGFAEYCEKRKRQAKPGERLFGDAINIPDDNPGKYYTKRFSDYLVNIGLKKRDGTKQDANICFHSLRHTYISSLRRIRGASNDVLDDLSGHEAGTDRTINSRKGYGSLNTPSELYPYVCDMKFDVDLSHLKNKT